MAEGGDFDFRSEDPNLDDALDNDDDDNIGGDDDNAGGDDGGVGGDGGGGRDRGYQPYQPFHGGEEFEMQERNTHDDDEEDPDDADETTSFIPSGARSKESAWKALTKFFPNAKATALEVFL